MRNFKLLFLSHVKLKNENIKRIKLKFFEGNASIRADLHDKMNNKNDSKNCLKIFGLWVRSVIVITSKFLSRWTTVVYLWLINVAFLSVWMKKCSIHSNLFRFLKILYWHIFFNIFIKNVRITWAAVKCDFKLVFHSFAEKYTEFMYHR